MGKYSAVVSAVQGRLDGHVGTGKILQGWKVKMGPLAEVEGEKDFPTVRIWVPDLTQVEHTRIVGEGGMTLKLSISSSRKAGLVQWIEDVEKVLDAIETDHTTGNLDLGLNGTLQRPMLPQVQDNFANELSINAQIRLSVMPRLFTRGARRATE